MNDKNGVFEELKWQPNSVLKSDGDCQKGTSSLLYTI